MELPVNIKELSAVGSDEVGVGDYLGPLVVASVYVEDHQIEALQALGIRDSKGLTDDRIGFMAEKIKDMLTFKLVIFENKYYNAMIDQGLNAHVVKSFLHNKAIGELISDLPTYPEYIIVDEFVSKEWHFKYLNKLPKKQDVVKDNLYFVKKGETVHIAVAAASILARYAFINYMNDLSQQYDMEILKGASSKVDACSKKFLEAHGEAAFKNLCKWHFANTKRVIS